MGWIIAIVIVAIIACCMDSVAGKAIIIAGVIALGLLLLSWVTGVELLISLAKMCAVVIVIIIVSLIVIAIAKK